MTHTAHARFYKVTGKPRPDNLLAQQILDPRYFQGLYKFCHQVAETLGKMHRCAVTSHEVEGILRVWADSALLMPQGKLEEDLFHLLDAHVPNFKGWVQSPDAKILVLDHEEDEEIEI